MWNSYFEVRTPIPSSRSDANLRKQVRTICLTGSCARRRSSGRFRIETPSEYRRTNGTLKKYSVILVWNHSNKLRMHIFCYSFYMFLWLYIYWNSVLDITNCQIAIVINILRESKYVQTIIYHMLLVLQT